MTWLFKFQSVPAFGSKTVDIVFSPEAADMCVDDAKEISCISYALGYMSLDIKVCHI